jgi:signal transduction histidine kinase
MSHTPPDQTSDLVAYCSFPALADALRRRIGAILQKWEQATRQLLPQARSLSQTAFRDDVPLTLQRLADALAAKRPVGLYQLEDIARVHGTSRFDQDFSVRDMVVEFRLLRRIILEQVHEELGSALSFEEIVQLSMATDAAFQEALLTFVEHQRAELKVSISAESKFLSFISHDLRNHLNHVTLVLQLVGLNLAKNPAYAADVEDLRSVQNSIFETTEGMEKLLQSERLRKGNVKLERGPVNLRHFGAAVMGQFQQRAQEKKLELRLEIPEAATLMTDPQLLGLAVQNLLGNAIKYTVAGSVTLRANPWSEAGGSGWTLSVADTGPGIPEKDFKTLFEAFTRSETHGQPGLGLGLAIASQAARLLGGSLALESTMGVGTVFHVKLPMGE